MKGSGSMEFASGLVEKAETSLKQFDVDAAIETAFKAVERKEIKQ